MLLKDDNLNEAYLKFLIEGYLPMNSILEGDNI